MSGTKSSVKQSPLELIIRFIGIRPRSTHEVTTRLLRYGMTDPAPILAQISELGLLNDADFARWLVESRTRSQRSPRAIRVELARHHLPAELIADLVRPSPDVITQQITSLLTKKYGPPHLLEKSVKQRVFRYLLGRGFPWEQVASVVKTYEKA